MRSASDRPTPLGGRVRRDRAGLQRPPVGDNRQGSLFDENGNVGTSRSGRSCSEDHGSADRVPPAEAAAATSVTVARPPSNHAHPGATREVRLGSVVIAYAFTRSRRRSIGMVVGPEGLSVRAPRWVGLRDVEAALHERAAWILEHLAGQHARALEARQRDEAWRDGGSVNIHGVLVRLVVDATVRGCLPSWDGHVPPEGATLRVAPRKPPRQRARADSTGGPQVEMPTTVDTTIRDAVHAWLQARAGVLFAQRCAHYAPQLGVQVQRLGLSAARTRWGSAGVDGSIRLNWRLMHHPLDCIDYVVVHELAHLRHMNHGPAFWALVESVLPDHRRTRRRLRDEAMSE